ncbi:hypothetical protein DVG80_33810 [Rhodococcus erythropolis]|nr:hypothetical protein DVG80_33810 [Rhodococcus erythropolis]
MLKKIAYGAGLVIVVLLATLAGQYLFVLATGTRFNETQWAAAGAWFGGIMTFGAVSVALGQTWLTKTKADQDIANLKAQGVTDRLRHKVELAKADERLAQQLARVIHGNLRIAGRNRPKCFLSRGNWDLSKVPCSPAESTR